MNENQIRDIVKKVFIMVVLSVIPLIVCSGCGGNSFGCKLDCSNCIDSANNVYEYESYNSRLGTTNTREDVSAFRIKGCNGIFGCDILGSCIWNKYLSCFDINSNELDKNSSTISTTHSVGCLNAYQICSGACKYASYYDSCYFYSESNAYDDYNDCGLMCSSCRNITLGCGFIDGCACVVCSLDDDLHSDIDIMVDRILNYN